MNGVRVVLGLVTVNTSSGGGIYLLLAGTGIDGVVMLVTDPPRANSGPC